VSQVTYQCFTDRGPRNKSSSPQNSIH